MIPKDIDDAYDGFYEATGKNKALDGKTLALVRLAASMAYGCTP